MESRSSVSRSWRFWVMRMPTRVARLGWSDACAEPLMMAVTVEKVGIRKPSAPSLMTGRGWWSG